MMMMMMMMMMMIMMMMSCFFGMADRQNMFSFISAGTIVRDSHHCQTPTRREEGLNLRQT